MVLQADSLFPFSNFAFDWFVHLSHVGASYSVKLSVFLYLDQLMGVPNKSAINNAAKNSNNSADDL